MKNDSYSLPTSVKPDHGLSEYEINTLQMNAWIKLLLVVTSL
jgi:hypothetical protein